MTKKVITIEMEILKKLSTQGISVPLDLNDVTVIIEYVTELEKKLHDYEECISLIVEDLRKHDYIHIVRN